MDSRNIMSLKKIVAQKKEFSSREESSIIAEIHYKHKKPRVSGIDATEKVNRLYSNFLKRN